MTLASASFGAFPPKWTRIPSLAEVLDGCTMEVLPILLEREKQERAQPDEEKPAWPFGYQLRSAR